MQATVPVGLHCCLYQNSVHGVHGVDVAAGCVWLFCLCFWCPPGSKSKPTLNKLWYILLCAFSNNQVQAHDLSHLTVTLLPNQSYKPPSSVHLSAQLDFCHWFCSGKVAGQSTRRGQPSAQGKALLSTCKNCLVIGIAAYCRSCKVTLQEVCTKMA